MMSWNSEGWAYSSVEDAIGVSARQIMLSLIAALSVVFFYGNAIVTPMTFFNRTGYDFAVLFLLVYFVATLWPFRWQSLPERIANGASHDRHVMRFPSAGMINTTEAPSWLKAAIRQRDVAIRLRVRSDSSRQFGRAHIFTISQDTGHRNLTLAQRGASLNLRLRSTATAVNGRPSYYIPNVFATSVWRDIHLVINRESMRLTIDGKTAVSKRFDEPPLAFWDDGYRIAFGNELTGDRPWLGEINLAEVTVADQKFDLLNATTLVIPTRYWLGEGTEPVFFIPELLALNRSGVKDIALNVLGFVPFGYVLANGHGRKSSVLLAIGVAAVASLLVEVSQTWIATRHSSLLDWILNTSGAWLDAVVRWPAHSAAKR